MKLARFTVGATGPRFGIVASDRIASIAGSPFDGELRPAGEWRPLSAVQLLAPCEPSKLVLASGNYPVIVSGYEKRSAPPAQPTIFLKPNSAVIGEGAPIVYPRISSHLTYEPELGYVLSQRARNVKAADARDYILGWTCVNDASARDIQESDEQWTRGKSFDSLAPVGPWIETELDPGELEICAYVNGEQRVKTNSNLAYADPFELLEFISACMTLLPGDIVSTGAAFLGDMFPGDTVAIEIQGIGRLTNPVIAEPALRD